jgi:hypothetical protein
VRGLECYRQKGPDGWISDTEPASVVLWVTVRWSTIRVRVRMGTFIQRRESEENPVRIRV